MELGGIEGGRHDDDLEIRTAFRDILEQTHENVGRESTLVSLVENDGRVSGEHVVVHRFSEEHTIRHVPSKALFLNLLFVSRDRNQENSLEESVGTRAVFETNAVSDFLAERNIHLVRDTLRDTHRRDSPGLCTCDLESGPPEMGQICVRDVLRDPVLRELLAERGRVPEDDSGDALGGLAGSSLSRKYNELALVEHREELAHLLVDGELFADFENVKVAFRVGPEGERVGLSGL